MSVAIPTTKTTHMSSVIVGAINAMAVSLPYGLGIMPTRSNLRRCALSFKPGEISTRIAMKAAAVTSAPMTNHSSDSTPRSSAR